MYRLLIILFKFLPVVCFFTPVWSYCQNLPELVKKTKSAIVIISLYESSGYESGGTGFFIDENGTCVSAYHVFDNAETVTIETSNGKKYELDSIIAADKKSDIVKFAIKNPGKEKFPYLKLSDTVPEDGESVFMIGNPLGNNFSVTSGIISAVREENNIKQLQTTAPGGQGSSGSPLMNMKGEVVGVMSFVRFLTQNMSFASAVNQLKDIKDDGSLRLQSTGTVPLNPHQIDSLIDFARDVFGNRGYDSALAVLNPLFKNNPNEMQQINIMWHIGSCYYMKRDYQKSLTYFEHTIDKLFKKSGKTPEMVFIYCEALHKAGMCEYYLGLKEDALQTIEKSIEISMTGLANDSFRKDLYITMLQVGYYSIGAIKLDLGDLKAACINFKLSREYGYDKVEEEIEKFCK